MKINFFRKKIVILSLALALLSPSVFAINACLYIKNMGSTVITVNMRGWNGVAYAPSWNEVTLLPGDSTPMEYAASDGNGNPFVDFWIKAITAQKPVVSMRTRLNGGVSVQIPSGTNFSLQLPKEINPNASCLAGKDGTGYAPSYEIDVAYGQVIKQHRE